MRKKVLLVDDDPDLRDILQDILEDDGYEVIPAADGSQAIEYLRTNSSGVDAPALVILDLNMPMVNGLGVLDAIREDTGLQLPVIVVSASGHSKPNGVAAYLQKPINVIKLLDTVRDTANELRRAKRSTPA
jgi:two-component system nitrogen regulation response regulator NtrX